MMKISANLPFHLLDLIFDSNEVLKNADISSICNSIQ